MVYIRHMDSVFHALKIIRFIVLIFYLAYKFPPHHRTGKDMFLFSRD